MGESAASGQCSTKQQSSFLGVIETAKRKNYRCLPLTHFRLLRSPDLSLALQARPRTLPGRRSTLLRALLRHCICRRCRHQNRLRWYRTVRNCSRLKHWSVEDRMRAFSPAAPAFTCPYRLVAGRLALVVSCASAAHRMFQKPEREWFFVSHPG